MAADRHYLTFFNYRFGDIIKLVICVFLDRKLFTRTPTKYFLGNDCYYNLIMMEFKKNGN